MNSNILVFTDSLGLPRNYPEIVDYDDTWPELFRKKGYGVFKCSIGGATSSDLRRQITYYNSEVMDVDTVIVQCGIVDCAPRFLRKWELDFLKGSPVLGRKIIKVLNKNYIRKLRNISYTSKVVFAKNLEFFRESFPDQNIRFIGIVPPTRGYEKLLPGIGKRIEDYNEILRSNKNYIDVGGIENFGIMSDYHHLNKIGHQFIFDKLLKSLG